MKTRKQCIYCEYLFVIKCLNLQNTKTLALICDINMGFSQLSTKQEVNILFFQFLKFTPMQSFFLGGLKSVQKHCFSNKLKHCIFIRNLNFSTMLENETQGCKTWATFHLKCLKYPSQLTGE